MRSKIQQYARLLGLIILTAIGAYLGITVDAAIGLACVLLFAPGIAIMIGAMWPKLFAAEPLAVEPLKEIFPCPVHLRAPRSIIIFLGVGSASMGTGILLMALNYTAAPVIQIALWCGTVFFLGGAAVALFKGIRVNRLCLRGNEMEMTHGGATNSYSMG